jgi:hypothetical protein
MSWNSNRQSKYFFGVLLFVLVVAFLFLRPIIFKAPTCFDAKQNADETGIDCGGSCALFCTEEAKNISVKWARAFKVIDGRFNVAAYVENQNTDAVVKEIGYIFKVYDKENRFIVERVGKTYISAAGAMVVFEPGLITGGNREPAFVRFEFLGEPVWYREPAFAKDVSLVVTEDPIFLDQATTPKLTATIVNKSFQKPKDIDVYAVLYDENENALAVSKTILSEIERNSSAEVFFSWFLPIEGVVVRKEIITNFDPFSAIQ